MTVATSASGVTVQGNGIATTFSFSFVGAIASDIAVYYTDADDVSTLLDPADFTLTLAAALPGQIWGYGGNVTYPLSGDPIATGTSVTIVRDLPYVQETSLSNQLAFYPQSTEIALDYEMMCMQQLADLLNRGLHTGPADDVLDNLPEDRAGKCLAFDNNGQPIAVTCSSGGVGPPGPAGVGGVINIRYFTSGSGTYTATSGTAAVIIQMVGAGGGAAGGANADAAKCSIGSGGGGGGYVERYLTSGFDGVAYAVGAAGAGGSNAGTSGSDGGDTTFAAGGGTLTAFGGKHGSGFNNVAVGATEGDFIWSVGGAGGAATGGDINVPGQTPSTVGFATFNTTNCQVLSGPGGSSLFGMGAPSAFATASSTSASAGINATGYGAGGSGAAVGSSGTGKGGGSGSAGFIKVTELA